MINFMMAVQGDRPLFKIWTTARLSQWNWMRFLFQDFPHNIAAMTIGYNSWNAMDNSEPTLASRSWFHALANHWPWKYPPYPIFISRGAEGPGREILQRPPSVCLSVRLSVRLSVTFSFRTVTKKRIDVFSRNFAGMCTMSWGCAV